MYFILLNTLMLGWLIARGPLPGDDRHDARGLDA